jgi:hypothetical protein
LPADDSSNGFDNISLGGLDPGRLERYLSAAQRVSRVAVGAPIRSPFADTVVLPSDLAQNDHMESLPLGTRGGTAFRYNFPLDAEYDIRLTLGRGFSSLQVAGLSEPHDMVVTLDGVKVKVLTVVPPVRGRRPAEDQPDESYAVGKDADADLHFRVPVKAGPRMVGVAFVSKGFKLSEKQRQPFQRVHITVGEDQRTQPTLHSVTVTGPFDSTGPGDTPSRRRIFVCNPAKPTEERACARRIMSTLARRAYRRPVTESDLGMLLNFYDQGRAAGEFEAGIEVALRRLLVTPDFLFRIERDPAGVGANTRYRISDLELASRLSFFLWSTIPDDELLNVASRGGLKDARVLEQQVRRMLADHRAEALVTNFAAQWLYLRNLPAQRPDSVLFPDFDETLRQAFRRETELFVGSVIREDRSALDLLRANYSFLNERLAKHYGVPNIYGSHFRRVTFGADSVRGGLLGQGSILTVTAYPNRTSPVVRGKWILENLLGVPPPPPPPNVPPLKDDGAEKALTMRERMVQHRRNPACASCHALMDPIGLSLENFDATGRWRTQSESFAPLDVSGSLPDGATFEGAAGLKEALLRHSDQIIDTLTHKLLTYAIGRPVDYYDEPAVRRITRDAATDDYRFSSLILGIVKSVPFQMRKSSPENSAVPAKAVALRHP